MNTIYVLHATLGEMVLPAVIVLAAIWLTVRWKPEAQPDIVARLFPMLVGLQFLLGTTFFVYGLASGAAGRYLGFPFILHPILGLLAVILASRVSKPRGWATKMGRWTPLATLGVLLVIVMSNILIANAT